MINMKGAIDMKPLWRRAQALFLTLAAILLASGAGTAPQAETLCLTTTAVNVRTGPDLSLIHI